MVSVGAPVPHEIEIREVPNTNASTAEAAAGVAVALRAVSVPDTEVEAPVIAPEDESEVTEVLCKEVDFSVFRPNSRTPGR